MTRQPAPEDRKLFLVNRGLALYLGVLTTLGLASLLLRPIVAVDADLFFHLAHGRQIWSEGTIPSSSYFSFIAPPKEGVNYYWLFEAIVYAIYSVSGFHGLIVFRALCFGLLLAAVGYCLFAGVRGSPARLWLAFLFGLYLTQSLHKYLLVRPHIVSYLFVAVFVAILEAAPRRAWILPLLAVVWTNVHGIEYPVMILITGAYAAGPIWRILRQRSTGEDVRLLTPLLFSMCGVFLTPHVLTHHGLALLRLPFQSTGFVSAFINEMARLGPEEYFVYQLSTRGFTTVTLSNLLILIGLIGAAAGLVRRRLALPHLLMAGGGLFLLTQGVRFTHECALLLLPLAKSLAPQGTKSLAPQGAAPEDAPAPWHPRPAVALAVAIALATPLPYLAARLPTARSAYPVSLADLPHGIASFLDQVEASGKVMNNPNHGAYLLWTLYPRYRIHMDLEVAFLFDADDMFELATAFYDGEALRKFLARYDPEFIAAPIAARGFPALIAEHPEYALVFFDDTAVLYADRERYPEIAERYGLDVLDPYSLAGTHFSALDPATADGYRSELERMIGVDPRITSVNQAAAILHNLAGRHQEAIERAEAVIHKEPAVAQGHALKADALAALGDTEAAVRHYRRALAASTAVPERQALHRSLARCLSDAERFGEAYDELAKAVGEFNIEASYVDLYNLGVLAAASGQPDTALRMFRFALYKVPPEEPEWRQRIARNLAAVTSTAPSP